MKTEAASERSSSLARFHARKALRWAFNSWGMKHLACLAPLALADQQGRLAVPEEAVPNPNRSYLRGPETRAEQGVEQRPGSDSAHVAFLAPLGGPLGFGEAEQGCPTLR